MSERTEQVQDLGEYIRSTPYQVVGYESSQDPQADPSAGVTNGADNPQGVQTGEGLSPAVTNEPGSPSATQGPDGVTTQTAPGSDGNQQFIDPRMFEQLQQQNALLTQTIQNQTRFIQTDAERRAQAEEEEFQRRIQDMDPDEREKEIAIHERDKLRDQISFAQRQQQFAERQKQLQAKGLLASMVASEHGLPIQDARKHLLRARNMDDMQDIARDLVSKGYGRPVQQAQQVQQMPPQEVYNQQGQQVFQSPAPQVQQQYSEAPVNPAHLAGDVSSSSDVTPEVKWGSGDLMSYIQQQQWQVREVEQ